MAALTKFLISLDGSVTIVIVSLSLDGKRTIISANVGDSDALLLSPSLRDNWRPLTEVRHEACSRDLFGLWIISVLFEFSFPFFLLRVTPPPSSNSYAGSRSRQ
jgi:hypothetical protein